uniref:hypothetical protein n=1 Tax=Pseudomonas neuropathica TaxID=2730425 RepID=UPI001E5A3E04
MQSRHVVAIRRLTEIQKPRRNFDCDGAFAFELNSLPELFIPDKLFYRQNKTPTAFAIGVSEFNLDDDLLSHGETPHYHRRCIVSLLSS